VSITVLFDLEQGTNLKYQNFCSGEVERK